jgi:hypothetical protein
MQQAASASLDTLSFLYSMERVLASISKGVMCETTRSEKSVQNTLRGNFGTQRMELPRCVFPDLIEQLANEVGAAGDIARSFGPLPEPRRRGPPIHRPGVPPPIEKQNVVVPSQFVQKARLCLEQTSSRKQPAGLSQMCNALRSCAIVKYTTDSARILATLRRERVMLSPLNGAPGKLIGDANRAWELLEEIQKAQSSLFPVVFYTKLLQSPAL